MTFEEAQIEALQKEVLRLNIEIINRDFKIQQLEDEIITKR